MAEQVHALGGAVSNQGNAFALGELQRLCRGWFGITRLRPIGTGTQDNGDRQSRENARCLEGWRKNRQQAIHVTISERRERVFLFLLESDGQNGSHV